MADDGDPVDESLHLGEKLAAHEEDVTTVGEGAQQRAQGTLGDGIEAIERLIEQEHLRRVQQGGGEREPLLHAEGERLDVRCRPAGEPDEGEQFVDSVEGAVQRGEAPDPAAGGARSLPADAPRHEADRAVPLDVG